MDLFTLVSAWYFQVCDVGASWVAPFFNIRPEISLVAVFLITSTATLFIISFINYMRFRFLNYLLFSLFLFFFLLAFTFSYKIIQASSVGERLLYIKLVTISFSTGGFFFTFFMLKSSIIRKHIEPYIIMGLLYGLELLDAIYFRVAPDFLRNGGYISAPVRSIYGYYFRSLQLTLGYGVFLATCLLFFRATRSRKRRWETIVLSILLVIFVITGTIFPIVYYGSFPVVVQYVVLFFSIIIIVFLMIFDPFLLIVWSGRLKGFIVYHRDNILIFHDFVEEIYAELVSKYLNHVLKSAEDLLIGKEVGLKNITFGEYTLDIYNFGDLYVAILHRDIPEIIVPLIRRFIEHLRELVNRFSIDLSGIQTEISLRNELKEVFDRDICSKIC
ncbi:MAG: hypothetical protein ACP6IP_06950 [Candidatus Njordarchaeia archaeon]